MVQDQRLAHNRFGIALQVCALRYLGFVPAKLHSAPPAAIGHLARQLGVAPRCLAQYGERSQTRTSHLQEALAHLQSLVDIADETIDQFDRCLAEAHARAGHDLMDFRGSVAQTTNEMVRLVGEVARVVLDPTVRDAQLRHAIYRRIPVARFQRVVEESTRIVRPDDLAARAGGQCTEDRGVDGLLDETDRSVA